MASWCWGFALIIRKLRERYSNRLNVALILGGLCSGTTEPIAPAFFSLSEYHPFN